MDVKCVSSYAPGQDNTLNNDPQRRLTAALRLRFARASQTHKNREEVKRWKLNTPPRGNRARPVPTANSTRPNLTTLEKAIALAMK